MSHNGLSCYSWSTLGWRVRVTQRWPVTSQRVITERQRLCSTGCTTEKQVRCQFTWVCSNGQMGCIMVTIELRVYCCLLLYALWVYYVFSGPMVGGVHYGWDAHRKCALQRQQSYRPIREDLSAAWNTRARCTEQDDQRIREWFICCRPEMSCIDYWA